jgi:hypothetical protein
VRREPPIEDETETASPTDTTSPGDETDSPADTVKSSDTSAKDSETSTPEETETSPEISPGRDEVVTVGDEDSPDTESSPDSSPREVKLNMSLGGKVQVSHFTKLKRKTHDFLSEHKTSPLFWAFVVFAVVVVASGAAVFLSMTGLVKFDDPKSKDYVIEVNSQILNGLFTLTAIYTHPGRIINTIFLVDHKYSELQHTYSWASRNSRRFLWLTLLLLNGNCIFQYPITALMWAWIGRPEQRPFWAITYLFLPLSLGCAIAGGVVDLACKKKYRNPVL